MRTRMRRDASTLRHPLDGASFGATQSFTYRYPVVLAGVVVGVLDILAAFAMQGFYGVVPTRVLQGIASGILGTSAYAGGAASAALGMALHLAISLGAAAAYYAVSRWWRFLVTRPTLCGMTYGVIVHAVMNQLVLPLSRVQFRAPPWHFTASMIVIHMLFVGLPIALIVARSGTPGREGGPAR